MHPIQDPAVHRCFAIPELAHLHAKSLFHSRKLFPEQSYCQRHHSYLRCVLPITVHASSTQVGFPKLAANGSGFLNLRASTNEASSEQSRAWYHGLQTSFRCRSPKALPRCRCPRFALVVVQSCLRKVSKNKTKSVQKVSLKLQTLKFYFSRNCSKEQHGVQHGADLKHSNWIFPGNHFFRLCPNDLEGLKSPPTFLITCSRFKGAKGS